MLILLPEQSLDSAALVAERLRAAVESLAIPHAAGGPGGVVTISAGVAHLEQSDDADPEAVLKRADQALYAAKDPVAIASRSGRIRRWSELL